MNRSRDREAPGLIRDTHKPIRSVLRVLGPLVLLAGLIFTIIGFVSFFSSFGSAFDGFGSGPGLPGHSGFGPPRYFWCAFVGLPLMAVGGYMSAAGFAGTILRYVSSEASPVGKDTFNYMAKGTRSGVDTLTRTVGRAWRDERVPGREQATVVCPSCTAENDPGSRFCDQCGKMLATEVVCGACQARNEMDARFCDECGRVLVK